MGGSGVDIPWDDPGCMSFFALMGGIMAVGFGTFLLVGSVRAYLAGAPYIEPAVTGAVSVLVGIVTIVWATKRTRT